MRALRKTDRSPGLTLHEVAVGQPGPGEVLVRVLRAGICGTDLHIHRWDAWAASRVRPLTTLGHEFCGVVAAVGPGVAGVTEGERVSVECHINCGRCLQCRSGQAHICPNIEIIGVDRDGAFADYVVVPARNLWRIPHGIPVDVAAIMDPIGNAVHAALSASLVAARVVVIGCGPIGLIAVAVARSAGASLVAATDVRPRRLELARIMGADLAVDAREDVAELLLDATGGVGADVVLEMSGHPNGLHTGLRVLRNGGHVALLGLPSRPVELDLTNLVIFKGATVLGVFGRRLWETWEQSTRLLQNGLDVTPVITHRFPLEAFEEAFSVLESGEAGKVVFEIGPDSELWD
ncbi:MAG: L-threonine 3-dehydrogenase [Armatimonadota bacterium]|nr:L-threonine 3-dehydrogenase [Armatimonadota bacterium]MDR5696457.1 L-threonine 3-dehydrogenase [Armatimonadota bacterium]